MKLVFLFPLGNAGGCNEQAALKALGRKQTHASRPDPFEKTLSVIPRAREVSSLWCHKPVVQVSVE